MPVTIEDSAIRALIERLKDWSKFDIRNDMERGTRAVKELLRNKVLTGRSLHDTTYPKVKDVTQDMPISYGNPYKDTRLRGEVAPSRTALNVTGESANSLEIGKTTITEFVIYIDGERANLIFNENARNNSRVDKPKRDPLGLTEKGPGKQEIDLVADELEKAIERIVSGL